MSINGILGGAGGIGYPIGRPAARPSESGVAPQTRPSASEAARESAAKGRATSNAAPQGALSGEPPPGTDPALWSVLTSEERAYYAKVQALGPLTYRPGAESPTSTPAVRGGRLDVRA